MPSCVHGKRFGALRSKTIELWCCSKDELIVLVEDCEFITVHAEKLIVWSRRHLYGRVSSLKVETE